MERTQSELKAGAILIAESPIECPRCHKMTSIQVKLSIQNLLPLSMVLWSHEDPVTCPACNCSLIPVISSFDVNAIKWTLSPIQSAEEKPLIERPGSFDVTKIMRQ